MTALAMTFLLVLGLGAFAWTARRRWRLMRAAAAPDDRGGNVSQRIAAVLKYVLGQERMFRYRWAGVAHAAIFAGFVVLSLRTIIMAARGYTSDPGFGFWLLDDDAPLGKAYLLLKDVIGVLVIGGVLYFLHARLIAKPRRMTLSGEGVLILLMILGLMLADLTYEASGAVRQTRGRDALIAALSLGGPVSVREPAEMLASTQLRSVTLEGDEAHIVFADENVAALRLEYTTPLDAATRADFKRYVKPYGSHPRVLAHARLLQPELPAASALALVVQALPGPAVSFLHGAGFWLHTIIVLAFLNFLPYGKHFHVLTVVPNVYFRDQRGIGRLRKIDDIEGRLEREETLGVKTARDFSWKAALDFYTCTECGRCSDHCPAYNTGKLLSPKQLTIDLRDQMYRNEGALVTLHDAQRKRLATGGDHGPAARATAGGQGTPGAADSGPPGVAFVGRDGKPDETNGVLAPAWVNPEVLWACTTCGACEQECPVFISYVDKIVDLRRNLVLERGEFPDQLQNAFRGLESVGNVYSFANEQRADWAQGLDVPLRSAKPDAEYLYWVGCSPSFDDRARKIARATAQLLKQAGVDFAILGPEETCTGDPARRAGAEHLFQMLAQQNCETLKRYDVRKIVTTCPHCFNTLKNEYPEFGGRFEVLHHTELLSQLVRAGRLKPEHHVDATIVFHDSCYLGRYNDVYDAPREVLRSIPGLRVVEARESRDRGMCCGAGGAQMWKEEEPIRREQSREGNGKVNHARARQLLRVLPTGPQAPPPAGPQAPSPAPPVGRGSPTLPSKRMVASACPFCMTMLRDGLTDQGHEDVEPLDVAEALWRSVSGES